MYKDRNGYSALHKVLINIDNTTDESPKPIEVVSKIIDIGGRQLAMKRNYDRSTALHLACRHKFSIKSCSKFINIGGRELIMETGHFGDTPLHDACKNQPSIVDVIAQLINIRGKEIVRKRNNYGLHDLHNDFYYTDDELSHHIW